MTEQMKMKRKHKFPAGIFLILFLIESIAGTGAVLTYCYTSCKRDIKGIEQYTVNYSKTMAEAFARVAEFSYKSKKYSSLKSLFHEKIQTSTIDEAFFVLYDGKLVVHSNTTIEKGLGGNIANDEMAYNIDLILQPVTKKSSQLFFSNYNIINKKIPFSRSERELLKEYIYEDIDTSGWLFTKGVFKQKKVIGSVNFIISKERIYRAVTDSVMQAAFMSSVVIIISFIISLIISLTVMRRYRAVKIPEIREDRYSHDEEELPEISLTQPEEEILFHSNENAMDFSIDELIDEPVDEPVITEDDEEEIYHHTHGTGPEHVEQPDDEYITIELLGEIEEEKDKILARDNVKDIRETKPVKLVAPVISMETMKSSGEIRDAIPVSRKR